MIIKYFMIFILHFSLLNASKILSYNIYDRTDRADVMVTFDTPYRGVIKQSISNSKIIIKLTDASIESSKIKKISSKFLESIAITPMLNKTQLVAIVPSYVKLIASKTADGYGLRLRFINKSTTTSKTHKKNLLTSKSNNIPSSGGLPTLKNTQMSTSYYIVVAILIIGIAILFYLKNKITQNNNPNIKSNWAFKSTEEKSTQPVLTPQNDNEGKISIRFQQELDSKNSVIMLDFSEYSYLLIVGEGNILLDKFTENRPNTQEDFNSILQDKHQVLNDFLQRKETHLRETPIEALQSYKEKAATMAYES